jgi:hypothetical protein
MSTAKQVYTVDPDGRIAFDPVHYDDQKRMFAAAGIDIESIHTEVDYQKAFSAAGDYFFDRLIKDARTGDKPCGVALQAFFDGRIGDFKALIRRQTFEIIEGGQSAPPRSS